jgi:hypothetical protein
MNTDYSLHFFIAPAGQRIEYARIQLKKERTWIGQTISLSRLDSSFVKTIRANAADNSEMMGGMDGDS